MMNNQMSIITFDKNLLNSDNNTHSFCAILDRNKSDDSLRLVFFLPDESVMHVEAAKLFLNSWQTQAAASDEVFGAEEHFGVALVQVSDLKLTQNSMNWI